MINHCNNSSADGLVLTVSITSHQFVRKDKAPSFEKCPNPEGSSPSGLLNTWDKSHRIASFSVSAKLWRGEHPGTKCGCPISI
ncbi:hypothetical protein Sjap_023800 [Stephania japonica]|uniref:Uncharacterized protein n=1 Tax=Stephania japonica TaxID=461633 RepID=A0AAP0EJK6_9MAGN